MNVKRFIFSLAILLLPAAFVDAQSFSLLHSFTNDAAGPSADLLLAGNVLYGTAASGSSSNNGAVFSIGQDGIGYRVLHTFSASHTNSANVFTNSDGAVPGGSLVLSSDTLYGTTHSGGTNGSGTLFSLKTNGATFTVLHTFGTQTFIGNGAFTNADGAGPTAGLLLLNNKLYGAAVLGGTNGVGTIFSLNLDGSGYTVLHAFQKVGFFFDGFNATFTNSEGSQPHGTLIASNGTLYGTAFLGGYYGSGAVFSLNTNSSSFTVLRMFSEAFNNNNADGANPNAGLFLSGNKLYGTTVFGGNDANGVVFSMDPNGGNFSVLHDFNPGLDGSNPYGGVSGTANTLYGTAQTSGNNGIGILFALAPGDTNFNVLHYFSGHTDDGSFPQAGVLLVSNTVYGTTHNGGAIGAGTIFSFALPGPAITTQPMDVGVGYGATTNFTVMAVYSTPPNLFYQWYYNGAPLNDSATISGSTNRTLTLTDVGANNAGTYYVIVADDIGPTYSTNASLVLTDAVLFVDANLEAGVLAALGQGLGPITLEELQNLTSLSLENQGIADVTELDFAQNLTQLDLNGNTLTNVSPLGNMTALQVLHLNNCGLTDLGFLKPLTNVYDLQINDNLFTDVSSMTNMVVNLTQLQMEDNFATNLPVLAALTNLNGFDVHNNNVTNISFMAGLINLQALDISQNHVSDVSVLTNITQLNTLYAGGNLITNASPLGVLTNLGVLYLSSNPVSNASFISGLSGMAWLALDNTVVTNISFLTNLSHLFYFDLSYIPARNLAPLAATPSLKNIGYFIAPGIGLSNTAFMNVMTNLQGVSLAQDGVTSIGSFSNLFLLSNVNLASDLLTNISALAGKTNIFTLDISYNAVHDLSPLAGLTNLNYFQAPGNGLSNITALAGMMGLKSVDLHSNNLQNISGLTNKTLLTSLDLSYNQITNVAPLGVDRLLFFLNLSHNDLQVINPLTSLTSLAYLDLTYNWLNLTNNSAASIAIQTLVAQNITVADLPQNSLALLVPTLAGVHSFRFTISSPPGLTYQVQFTTNLAPSHWLSLGNVTNIGGSFLFTDSTATNPIRFYRLLAQ